MTTQLRIISYLSIILAIAGIISCDRTMMYRAAADHDEGKLEHMQDLWSKYFRSGNHDSSIVSTLDFLRQSISDKDSVSVIQSCISIAQSYIFLEQLDSARHYLEISDKYNASNIDELTKAKADNLWGIYYLKSEVNYPKALVYFHDMHEYAKASGNAYYSIVALTNIVNIFYIKSDRHGIEYAAEAEKLANGLPDTPEANYFRCIAKLSVAQMDYLSCKYDDAILNLTELDSMLSKNGIRHLSQQTDIIKGDVYNATGNYNLSEYYYEKAIRPELESDPGMISMAYLNYGIMCEKQHLYDKAKMLYEKGISFSYEYDNILFRNDLLIRLSDILYRSGEVRKSYEYAHDYSEYMDSLSILETEQEFGALLLSYQNIKHANEINEKELYIYRMKIWIFLSVSATLIILISFSSLWILYKRKKKMHEKLVTQHQNYLKQINTISTVIEDTIPTKEDSEKTLFIRIELLMKDKKFFKIKDISLERLSEELNSNRTYISKVINKYSGMSFNNYINTYRINEATVILSDPDNDMLLKQIADDLGYNSISVFSKTFQKNIGLSPTSYRKEILQQRKQLVNS